MATKNLVNLDAMIPRQDFAADVSGHRTTQNIPISITHLKEGDFFINALRKPDFQRETSYWTPQKVADLVTAFLDRDLIPALIFWNSGPFIYVIDGAHRLSAILAWIRDDYGDRPRSHAFMGGQIPLEQLRAAKAARELTEKAVGKYSEYLAANADLANIASYPPLFQRRLATLSQHVFSSQWVDAVDAETAQKSFFKINESATPLDATERLILKSRKAANAIAARAIANSGGGNKYWNNFGAAQREAIEQTGRYIHDLLFEPPIDEGALKTLDVPVAGHGYNTLPFVFDLVNLANGVQLPTSNRKTGGNDEYEKDATGDATVAHLVKVQKLVEWITGNQPRALGLHPIVYFYTKTGAFQPQAFLGMASVILDLEAQNRTKKFRDHRAKFEQFLLEHKNSVSQIVHRFGSKKRSLNLVAAFFWHVLDGLFLGKPVNEIADELSRDPTYATAVSQAGGTTRGKAFRKPAKSATYIEQAIANVVRCDICGGALHRKSINTDHIEKRSKGGEAHSRNGRPTHFYCNSSRPD